MKFLPLVFKNLWRSKLRSSLTALAIVFLVAVFSMVATVLNFLDMVMTERTKDIRVIITNRFRIPSRFDRSWVEKMSQPNYELCQELQRVQGFHPEKHNLWHFIVFTLDPEMKDNNQIFFLIATLPEKIGTSTLPEKERATGAMTDGLEGFDPDAKLAELMRAPPKSRLPNIGILLGPERLQKLGKKVGDHIKARSISHFEGTGSRGPIEMEFEIVGSLPAGSRWEQGGFMDYVYLDRVLHEKQNEMDGQVNIGWLTVDDQQAVEKVGGVFEHPNYREVKAESAATTASRFLKAFENLLFGIKFLLSPAIRIVMTVIVANAISITVRERTKEIAVFKVLGFSKRQILALVLGEGLLLGVVAGFCGSAITYLLINNVAGGIRIPLGWFPVFFVPKAALWWGPAVGALTALLGGLVPSWNACRIKVSEVFARVA
jgi:putative ABC transport system permease protein